MNAAPANPRIDSSVKWAARELANPSRNRLAVRGVHSEATPKETK